MKIATLEEKCWSNTFKLQFKVKLELKRGNGESNPGGETWSNTFKLQFKVKLELKRGMAPWCTSHFWRLTSSLRLNWRLNVELLPEWHCHSGV